MLLSPADQSLVVRLQRGEEAAFLELVERYQDTLLRVAILYVRTQAVAEEVVQDTWLGVLSGINRFEGRSSLKTWLFRILINRAKTRGEREARMVPFSALVEAEVEGSEAAVDAMRFRGPQDEYPGHWAAPLQSWGEDAEKRLLAREAVELTQRAIDALPEGQRAVITLRDVKECTAEEVCEMLGISETNQRVLLHRARSRVRRELEQYFQRKPAD